MMGPFGFLLFGSPAGGLMSHLFVRVAQLVVAALIGVVLLEGSERSASLLAQGTRLAPADDAAVRDLVRRYVNAREARDPRAIEALFTTDADQLVSSGEWRRGRDAVVAGTLASSASTGGTREITVETVRMIGPDVALADGRYEISGLADGTTRRMWTSFVMVRQGGAWRISGIRNMLPAAPVGSPSAR
jgi:uncharacterized protein (TIGR02246 family)